jgi:hypothetical protein
MLTVAADCCPLFCACRFDRQKLTQKNINNTQYVACMNPTAGSFTINPRLQRLFLTLAVGFPGQDSLMKIYGTFLQVGGASAHGPAAFATQFVLPDYTHCSKSLETWKLWCRVM